MDYTRETLERVAFKSRGKWYLAQQVDAFIDEVADSARRDFQEVQELREERDRLREENARLRRELEKAQSAPAVLPGEERQRRVLQDLEQERDELIRDIKALRDYRERFRQAVEEDAQALLGQAKSLPSEKLL